MMPMSGIAPAPAASASAPSTIVAMLICRSLLFALAEADRMAAGDVAELVRDHALELVDVIGRLDEAGLDVDRLPGRNEALISGR
jgi:hypothetical protein